MTTGFQMKTRTWTAVKTCERNNLVITVNRSSDGLWNFVVGSRRMDGTLAPHIPIFQSDPEEEDPIRDDIEGDLQDLIHEASEFIRDALDQSPRRLQRRNEIDSILD